MRAFLAILLLVFVAACSPVACVDRDRDGGIGGTGTCEPDKPDTVIADVVLDGVSSQT